MEISVDQKITMMHLAMHFVMETDKDWSDIYDEMLKKLS